MNETMPRTPFSTPLSGSARETEIRIRNIFSGPKKRPPLPFLILVFSVCIFCGNLVSCQVKEAKGPEAEVWVDYSSTGEMPWDKSIELQLEEYPGVTFRWTPYGITAEDETGETALIGGMPVWNVFLCDLNGDGRRELCATVYFGSGITDSHIEVYDYDAKQWYILRDRMEYDYALSLEDGQLQVSRWEYQGGPPCQGEPFSVGRLALSSDDSLEGKWFIAQAAQFPWQDESDETEQPAPPESVAPPTVDPDPAARAAYVKTLDDLLYRDTLPDGTECTPYSEEYPGGFERMEDNTFAVADVDGDGREELVFLTLPNIYAGYRGWVLDYDQSAGSVRVQFDGFPSLTFYSNGALAEDDSHAQGVWADDVWPHSLYRYLPESDSYELAGHASAWEKAVSDINVGNLPPFPTEKDTSGAGILYYIHPISSYEYLNTFDSRVNMAVDQSVYLEWLEPILGNARPLELEYLPLTEENINRLK